MVYEQIIPRHNSKRINIIGAYGTKVLQEQLSYRSLLIAAVQEWLKLHNTQHNYGKISWAKVQTVSAVSGT